MSQSDTERLIAEVFRDQADRAPSHHRIQAALRDTGRTKAPWRRTAGFALVAAAVVAAVAVPVAVLSPGEDPAPASPGGNATSPAPSPAPGIEAGTRLTYRPRWLPDGFTEQSRSVAVAGGDWYRGWRREVGADPNQGPRITLSRSDAAPLPVSTGAGPTTPVDIGGHPGVTLDEQGPKADGATLIWQPAAGDQLTLTVSGVPDARDLVLRIARQTEPDTHSALAAPVQAGWLPATVGPDSVSVEGTSPADWSIYLTTRRLDSGNGKSVHIQVYPTTLGGDGGTPVAVRGGTGYFQDWSDGDTNGRVHALLPDGRYLSVAGALGSAELVRIADALTLAPYTPQRWIGTR